MKAVRSFETSESN